MIEWLMNMGQFEGKWRIQRKPASVPLGPPQIPHYLTWDQTQATTVGSWRLTTWAMAWPIAQQPECLAVYCLHCPSLHFGGRQASLTYLTLNCFLCQISSIQKSMQLLGSPCRGWPNCKQNEPHWNEVVDTHFCMLICCVSHSRLLSTKFIYVLVSVKEAQQKLLYKVIKLVFAEQLVSFDLWRNCPLP
jgi:hypothetical protein